MLLPAYTFDTSPVGFYFFFELPTFLFFSLFTAILYFWGKVSVQVIYIGKYGKTKRKQLEAALFIFNIILYVIFTIFLFIQIAVNVDNNQQTCAVGDLNQILGGADHYSINLGYQVLMASLCCVMCIAYVAGSTAILSLFRGSIIKPTQHRRNLIQKITIFACIFTIFFLIRSALFLYAAITTSTIPVLVWTIFETVPVLGLLYMQLPPKWQNWKTAMGSNMSEMSRERQSERERTTASAPPPIRSFST